MITRLILIVVFVLKFAAASGQAFAKSGLSEEDATTLKRSLVIKKEDTAQVDMLLRLAEYHLFKNSEAQADLDSAATFISQATTINGRLLSGKRDGLLAYYQGWLARRNGQAAAAKQWIDKAIAQLKAAGDEFHVALAYLELSLYYDPMKPEQATVIKNTFTAMFQRAPQLVPQKLRDSCMLEMVTFYVFKMRGHPQLLQLDFVTHMIRSYQLINDKKNEFWARKEAADIHYKQGHLNTAIDELLQMAKEQQAGHYPHISFTYDLLSGLYYSGGNYDRSLFYSLETIKNVHDDVDSAYLSLFYARVAMNYTSTGSTAEAVDWNVKRLNYLLATRQTNMIYDLLISIVADQIRLGKARDALTMVLDKKSRYAPVGNAEKRSLLLALAQCYGAVQNNVMAEKYMEELIELTALRIKRKEIPNDIPVDQFVANFYLNNRQYDKAEKYYKQVVDEIPDTRKGNHLLYRYSFLFRLDTARGNYRAAIKDLTAFHAVNDSIYSANKSKQIEELKISYATEQKDKLLQLNKENILLLTKQDDLQKTKLKQGALIRNISFAGLGLLIIIMALLYNRYRLKQRTNSKLELQQQEIGKQNIALHHLVDEKDWLVKEIHHRVKNNLQIVISLLGSQSANMDNETARSAIHDSQHRVQAMSLLHQKLYNTEGLSTIDISLYIRELVSYLADSYNTGQRIHFQFAMESLEMDVSQAVPFGLILNEAITNAIKYAFPDKRNGVIVVSLSRTASGQCLLSIADNGVGMPSGISNKKAGSLGMRLMEGLSQDLDGDFSIENSNGTTIKISFAYEPEIKRSRALTSS
jgi:two-component sensor histidine kinase